MIINQLNLNHIRIFECVYRTKSMTAAAHELHLTQSGVSQHIRAFEETVGSKLFDRINQRVVPTATATALYSKCKKSLHELEDAFSEIQAEKNQLAGRVHIGVPTEFAYNIMIPLVSKFCQKNPLVKFHFRLGYGAEMNQLLLAGDIDFAFVDEFAMDKRIKTKPVYDETLELCAIPEVAKNAPKDGVFDKNYFESINYVDFSKDEQILRRWFEHHCKNVGTNTSGTNFRTNVRSTVEDSQGVARLVLSGVGAGIMPGHLVQKLKKEGTKIHIYRIKNQPLKNTISIAQLKERTPSRPAQASMDFILTELEQMKKTSKEKYE